MRVADALRDVAKLGIDTAPFIYFTGANSSFVAVCREVFRHLPTGEAVGITSLLTLTEVLVHPVRTADIELEAAYCDLLLSTDGIISVPVDILIAHRAAQLRVQ